MPVTPCPYCGHPHDSSDTGRCDNCGGLFEPLSQTATQLAMGPWYVRDEDRPFMPGFNETILRQQVASGRITANTILRGPTTNQFWMTAADAPGVSRLMGTCHSCHQAVEPTDLRCEFCKSDMSLPEDVDSLGLRYTTAEQRAQAQQEIVEGRANPAPKTKSAQQPAAPKASKAPSAAVSQSQQASQVQAVAPAAQEPKDAYEDEEDYDDGNELAGEIAEDVWSTGPATTSRRRKRKNGADPLVIGMGVVLLCVVVVGGMIILTSGGQGEGEVQEEQAAEPQPERDSVAVSRVSAPAMANFERLVPEDIPAEFEERYAAIRRLVQLAEADKAAERYNQAYDTYKEIEEKVGPLENEIAQWREQEKIKAEYNALRQRVTELRQKAEDAEASRWAPIKWQEGQAAWDESQRLYGGTDSALTQDWLTQAESAFAAAERKSLTGQAAWAIRNTLDEAIQASVSEASLRKYANDQVDKLMSSRAEADEHLNKQRYAEAKQSYNAALDALREAKQVTELSRYRKFYAFEAGFQASALMLGAARGDGVDATAHSALAQLFEKLRLSPNPAQKFDPGSDVGHTIAIQPLVNDARDMLIKQHGEAVQACYLIGFHTSIIDETLKTNALDADQQKRIHQSLGTIEKAAAQAGWDIIAFRPVVDQVRITNRNAKLRAEPEATRSAWARLIAPMQSRESAPRLMDPVASPSTPADPELFPNTGS